MTALPATVENPRWLCGCGAEYPIDGLSYPVCFCGLRCRMVTGDGLPYVGTPAERLERARARYEELYDDYVKTRERLRVLLRDLDEGTGYPGGEHLHRQCESLLVTGCGHLAFAATELDRVEREVAG